MTPGRNRIYGFIPEGVLSLRRYYALDDGASEDVLTQLGVEHMDVPVVRQVAAELFACCDGRPLNTHAPFYRIAASDR
jgi:hypothetical protein